MRNIKKLMNYDLVQFYYCSLAKNKSKINNTSYWEFTNRWYFINR